MANRELTEIGAGWRWEYESGHGFVGKHFYNDLTGEALSVRQGQAVQRGEQTLSEAIVKTYMAYGEREHTREFQGNTYEYSIVEFRSLVGAIQFASQSDLQTYIVGYGHLRMPGGKSDTNDVGGFGFRTLMPRRVDASWYGNAGDIQEIYAKNAAYFSPSPRQRWYVWKKLR